MRKALAALAFLLLSQPASAQEAAFEPGGPTVTLAVTGTTARVQVQPSPPGSRHLRIYNSGTVAVFLQCGDSTVVATVAAGMPVAPGSVEVVGNGQTWCAGISAGTAATVYLTPGAGL
jgi:hypothetical protein